MWKELENPLCSPKNGGGGGVADFRMEGTPTTKKRRRTGTPPISFTHVLLFPKLMAEMSLLVKGPLGGSAQIWDRRPGNLFREFQATPKLGVGGGGGGRFDETPTKTISMVHETSDPQRTLASTCRVLS